MFVQIHSFYRAIEEMEIKLAFLFRLLHNLLVNNLTNNNLTVINLTVNNLNYLNCNLAKVNHETSKISEK